MDKINTRVSSTEEGKLSLEIVPLGHSFMLQIDSDILKGTLWLEETLTKEDMSKIMTYLFKCLEDITMGAIDGEKEFSV